MAYLTHSIVRQTTAVHWYPLGLVRTAGTICQSLTPCFHDDSESDSESNAAWLPRCIVPPGCPSQTPTRAPTASLIHHPQEWSRGSIADPVQYCSAAVDHWTPSLLPFRIARKQADPLHTVHCPVSILQTPTRAPTARPLTPLPRTGPVAPLQTQQQLVVLSQTTSARSPLSTPMRPVGPALTDTKVSTMYGPLRTAAVPLVGPGSESIIQSGCHRLAESAVGWKASLPRSSCEME